MKYPGLGQMFSTWLEQAESGKKFYTCPVCGGLYDYDFKMWVCAWCDHHWSVDEIECRNCHRSKKKFRLKLIPLTVSELGDKLLSMKTQEESEKKNRK